MVRLLLWSWAQGVGVAIPASKWEQRCATSAARCAMNRRLSAGDTLVSHRDGRTCGLPTSKGRSVTSLRHPARSCARVAHSQLSQARPGSSVKHVKCVIAIGLGRYQPSQTSRSN